MNKTLAVITTFALASFAGLALAQPGGGERHRHEMLERLKAADTNADGLLSRSEAAALPRLAEHFDALDANRDGQISFEELRAAHRERHARRFAKVDTDGDGKVSRAEALARATARFDRLDADKDGFLTPEELKAGRGKHGHRH